ncbi:MAG: heme biosynthesis HemY N-terminal domain-containing protein [Rickettsiales bacterium]
MAKFIVFLLLLIPLSTGAMWLMDHPGFITIEWFGYEIRMAMALVIVALAITLMLTTWLGLLFWQLFHWPEKRRLRKELSRKDKGLQQLTRSVTALALQDTHSAERALHQAVKLLPTSALPRLLAAQLAHSQGNNTKSAEHLRFLLGDKDTSLFATRRLIDQHMQQKQYEEALVLALQAHQDQPRDHHTNLVLMDLYFHCNRLDDVIAQATSTKLHHGLSRSERHRFAGIAYYLIAIKETEPLARLRALKHATNYAPDFLPAVILLAQHYIEQAQSRDAFKVLRRAWVSAPHPALLQQLLAYLAPLPAKRQRRIAAMLALKAKGTAEAALLEATIAQQQERYEDASRILHAAIAQHDRKPLYSAMADVAVKLSGQAADANPWFKRAMDAPNEPRWHCASCGASQNQWELHCTSCGALDSSVWGQPEVTRSEIQVRT